MEKKEVDAPVPQTATSIYIAKPVPAKKISLILPIWQLVSASAPSLPSVSEFVAGYIAIVIEERAVLEILNLLVTSK